MNYSGKIKILLDTTYLLPIVGIDVEDIEETITLLKSLRKESRLEIYYSQFSILEILGKISKLRYDLES